MSIPEHLPPHLKKWSRVGIGTAIGMSGFIIAIFALASGNIIDLARPETVSSRLYHVAQAV